MVAEPRGVSIKASWEITTWHFEDRLARRPGDVRTVVKSEMKAYLQDVTRVWGGE